MKLIVCLDDNGGILFNGRRLSRDSVLVKDIHNILKESKLYVSEYSYKLYGGNIIRDNDDIPLDGYILIEDKFYKYFNNADEIIIYYWNRTYPSDIKLPLDLVSGWDKYGREDFAGSSHEKITRVTYKKKGGNKIE